MADWVKLYKDRDDWINPALVSRVCFQHGEEDGVHAHHSRIWIAGGDPDGYPVRMAPEDVMAKLGGAMTNLEQIEDEFNRELSIRLLNIRSNEWAPGLFRVTVTVCKEVPESDISISSDIQRVVNYLERIFPCYQIRVVEEM